jgi:5-hydroxyisourate hydrolase
MAAGGRLTTHVLDTARGRPAAGVAVELARLDGDGMRMPLATAQTNDDGRTDAPLLADADLVPGTYELVFSLGAYFAGVDTVTEPPFLDRVPLRFGIADAGAHHHVPLLASPWAYSTYRGS